MCGEFNKKTHLFCVQSLKLVSSFMYSEGVLKCYNIMLYYKAFMSRVLG